MSAFDDIADAIADEIIRLLKQPNSVKLPEEVRIAMAVCMAVDRCRHQFAERATEKD